MSDLVADAEDLLRSVGDSNNPELQVLRSKLESSIDGMKTNLRQRLKARAEIEDDLKINPWVVAAVVALAAALLIGTITRRKA
jgi:ElaB/YqjD/DUF883 family membrane-anchored ribosome-binding protein